MDISPNPGPLNFASNSQNGSGLTQGWNLHTPRSAITTHAFFRDQPLLSQPITSLVSLRAYNNLHRRSIAVESRTLINVPIANFEQSVSSTTSLKFCNLNTRSLKNKSADFVCYVKSCAADIFAITETWFTDMDCAHRAEATPPGYKLYDHPRFGRTGGGTALLCREGITVTKVAAGEKRSFEFSEWIILSRGSRKIRIVIVYRLQYSPNHPVTTGEFFEEFSDYLESIILSSEPLLITGDFNIHVNVVGDPHRLKLLELLETMGLRQHVTTPTHESGNTLDLIITRQFEDLVKETPISDYHISDHWSVTCRLNLDKPRVIKKTVTFRRIKGVDLGVLSDEISSSDLCANTPVTLNDLVSCYNSTLASALDRHASLITKSIPARPLVPWFNDEIKEARRLRRRAERRWRRSGLEADFLAYKAIKNKTNNLMNEARKVFFTDFVEENCCDQRKLFLATKRLLGSENVVEYPQFDDKIALANKFSDFFIQKIDTIQTKLDNMVSTPPLCIANERVRDVPSIEKFNILSVSDVRKLIETTPKKSCLLDPMPTSLVFGCIDVLLPKITEIINLSLQSGVFADQWKCALVSPLLKKPGLELLLKNYRPVSNLQYISKLTEKAVFQQMHSNMTINSLYPEFQSSYRQHHSTETALLKVITDILLNMNSQKVTLMVLLDLSAAFDTVNHDILLERLDKVIGMRGVTLEWFRSYLSDRCQQVCIDGSRSNQRHLNCGVPQGSCLGPLLFVTYTSSLFKVIERHLPEAHCYADDTQLYVSFKPDDVNAHDEAIRAMEDCIKDIRNWLIESRLLLNDDKTEFLVIGTRQQLNKLSPSVLHVGDHTIDSSVNVRNLGSIFDNSISMDSHINQICKTAFYHIHNIRRISKYLSQESLKILVHAFVTSRLDYCNSLLYGLPKFQISKLQRVQNAAARLITNTKKYDHITPALYNLHWLPVFYRISFKILILTFKAIYNMSPSYISNLVSIKSCSAYSLRSNSSLFLDRPKGCMLSTLGARSFYAAAPTLWNRQHRRQTFGF